MGFFFRRSTPPPQAPQAEGADKCGPLLSPPSSGLERLGFRVEGLGFRV